MKRLILGAVSSGALLSVAVVGPVACADDETSSCHCPPCAICVEGGCERDPACGAGGAAGGGSSTGGAGGTGGAGAPLRDLVPDKFVPSFTVKYCGTEGALSPEQTAQFDLIDTIADADAVWAGNGLGSWRHLKELNPDMLVVLYMLGPGEYNTATWGDLGLGWEWMKTNHGVDAVERWTAIGAETGSYLQGISYDNERAMYLGAENWQQYWLEALDADWWQGGLGYDLDGADGIFADNTSYALSWENAWVAEGTSTGDVPADYVVDGVPQPDVWRADMNAFFARAVPWLADRNRILAPNFSYLNGRYDWWTELDSQPSPPFAAMEECGFYCSWQTWAGCDLGSTCYVDVWRGMVDTMASLSSLRVLMTNGAGMDRATAGLAAMDVPDSNDRTGWNALWFSLGSFLLGFDDERVNGFFGFTVWGYCTYQWLDELDPAFLHLGRALGPYAESGGLFLREFEDGWIAVNPTSAAVPGAPVPDGQARTIDHASLAAPDDVPLSSIFDVAAMSAVVLLREGRQLGNDDN